jgi:isoleucyl-tRNA synthetase
VTLSARYFDIIKDRLYTAAPRSHARRSAQTALYKIADALARMLAPILVFTSDEIWENLPASSGDGAQARPASVHLAEFPEAKQYDEELLQRWTKLFNVRDAVLLKLEEARSQKIIGSSLEARVEIVASSSSEIYKLLEQYKPELRFIFIVSDVSLPPVGGSGGIGVNVYIKRAEGEKCERCWNYSTRVGESSRYPSACERCVEALTEIEQEEVA